MAESNSPSGALLSAAAPQPLHGVIADHARARFSGCLTIGTPHEILVWFSDGEVVFAQVVGEQSVADRLVADRLLTAEQVRRGTVQVGQTRSLRFMADRCLEVDVHQLLLWAELATAAVLRARADQSAPYYESHRFAVHPEGLHHWHANRRIVVLATDSISEPIPAPPIEPGSEQFFLAIDAAWEQASGELPAIQSPSSMAEPVHEPVEHVDRRFALRSLIGGLRTRART